MAHFLQHPKIFIPNNFAVPDRKKLLYHSGFIQTVITMVRYIFQSRV